jgi:purine-binding chemotaxis protein CheW
MDAMAARHTAGPDEAPLSALAGKYLAFALLDQEYCLPVLKVREIIKAIDITHVPQVPGHVRGVINLRGRVIPVVDLRLKFGFPAQDYTERTCIIVVDVSPGGGNAMMGIVVDAVSEVLNIAGADIDRTPDFGGGVANEIVMGLARVRGSVKILLDLDRLLSTDLRATQRAS